MSNGIFLIFHFGYWTLKLILSYKRLCLLPKHCRFEGWKKGWRRSLGMVVNPDTYRDIGHLQKKKGSDNLCEGITTILDKSLEKWKHIFLNKPLEKMKKVFSLVNVLEKEQKKMFSLVNFWKKEKMFSLVNLSKNGNRIYLGWKVTPWRKVGVSEKIKENSLFFRIKIWDPEKSWSLRQTQGEFFVFLGWKVGAWTKVGAWDQIKRNSFFL